VLTTILLDFELFIFHSFKVWQLSSTTVPTIYISNISIILNIIGGKDQRIFDSKNDILYNKSERIHKTFSG